LGIAYETNGAPQIIDVHLVSQYYNGSTPMILVKAVHK